MNYKKLSSLKIEINNYLEDIKNYVEEACNYIVYPKSINDVDELLASLESIPECIEYIQENLYKIEMEYENERL